VKVNKEVHGLLSRSLVLCLNRDTLEGLKTHQLPVIPHKHSFAKLLNKALLTVDDLKEFVEAFNLSDRYPLEVNVCGAAQYLSEEVLSLHIVE